MAFRFRGILTRTLIPLIAIGVVGCTSSRNFYLRYDHRFINSDLDRILTEHPLSSEENIKVVTLGKGQAVSHHLVQVRDREISHIHKKHDLTVVVLKGKGYLMLGKRRVNLTEGDILFIPRGSTHYFVNTFSEPSVALAVFSPPFDGKDSIPVEKP